MKHPAPFHGVACPTGGEAHGPLHGPRPGTPGGKWVCSHGEHLRRAADDDPAKQRQAWTLEELQAAGVAP